MSNVFNRIRFGLAAAIIVFIISGCNNDPDDNIIPVEPTDITVEVRINSSTNDVLRGGEVTFLVAVKGTDNKTVTWSIDEKEEIHNETEISINEEGVVYLSVAEDETLGTLTIRATSNADPEKSGTVTVNIPVPTVEKIEILLPQPWVDPWQGRVDVGPGGAIEFTAKVTGKDFIREAVTWSIDDNNKHENTAIIDTNGVAQLRVAQTETLTSFKVRAVSKWDASKIGEVTVTVKEPTVTGVVILDHEGKVVADDPKNPKNLKAADSEAFRAIVTGTGKVNQDVTWSIERLTYIISTPIIQQDSDGKYTDGWGDTDLEIVIDSDEEVFTWVKTGEVTAYANICEKKPVERIPGTRNVKIWVTNWVTNDEGEEEEKNEQKTLTPQTGTTGVDANGEFTVDGQETFGKFKLTAISTADTTVKKEVIIQIDSSSDINIDIPEV